MIPSSGASPDSWRDRPFQVSSDGLIFLHASGQRETGTGIGNVARVDHRLYPWFSEHRMIGAVFLSRLMLGCGVRRSINVPVFAGHVIADR